MTALPRSLETLIADARRAKSQRQPDDDRGEVDDVMRSVDEFFDQLCRGEYSDELYWRCVGEDCLEDGDWEGAKAAQQRILDLEGETAFTRWLAYGRLAKLHRLLGDDDLSLECCRAANREVEPEDSDVIRGQSLSQEAWQLARMAQVRSALEVASRGLSIATKCNDYLTGSLLLAVAALCELGMGRIKKAENALHWGSDALERLRASWQGVEGMDDSPGMLNAYGIWWRVQAEYLRSRGDKAGEADALEQSLEKARQVASPRNFPDAFSDATVVERLLAAAGAAQRSGQADKASALLAEANEIGERRKLPESARRLGLVPSREK